MSTAQQAFAHMITAEVSPALRALGFTGSAGKYALPSTTHWALLGFQKSVTSSRDAVLFTVNVLAVGREEWDDAAARHPAWGPRPIAGYGYGEVVATERLGILWRGVDHWWELAAGDNAAQVAAPVIELIEAHALPWLRSRIGPEAALNRP